MSLKLTVQLSLFVSEYLIKAMQFWNWYENSKYSFLNVHLNQCHFEIDLKDFLVCCMYSTLNIPKYTLKYFFLLFFTEADLGCFFFKIFIRINAFWNWLERFLRLLYGFNINFFVYFLQKQIWEPILVMWKLLWM